MKKKKQSSDPNEMAFGLRAFTEKLSEESPKEEKKKPSPEASAAAKYLSSLGASKGGKARAESLSKKRRKEIAKKAAKSRWAKRAK